MNHTREVDNGGGGRYTYMVYFPRFLNSVTCKVEGYPKRIHTLGRIREHFMYMNWKANVAIL